MGTEPYTRRRGRGAGLVKQGGVVERAHGPPVLLHLPHRRRQTRQEARGGAEERRGDGVDEAPLEGDAGLAVAVAHGRDLRGGGVRGHREVGDVRSGKDRPAGEGAAG